MSSKVGGIAQAPVWGANPFLQIIEEFVALETERLCKFVSLVMFVP